MPININIELCLCIPDLYKLKREITELIYMINLSHVLEI